MTTNEIINIIRIAFAGRQIVGRIGITREDGKWNVIARVRNANGEGIRHEVLCSIDDCALAVDVRRHLMMA
jgi:hypothetical protein